MSNTIRTTISVPRKVKERMDKAEGVNWSAVAALAFEAKLLELETTMKVSTVEEAVARLKAAAATEQNVQKQLGMKEGREWAMQEATPRQLRLLANQDFDSSCPDWEAVIEIAGSKSNEGVATSLFRTIHPKNEYDPDDIRAFWERVLSDGDLIDDPDFALGFVEGALEFWESVESRV